MRAPVAIAVCALLLAVPTALRGQDPRLENRLDATTRRAVLALADSARSAGLPAEPLIQKALEGESKGADGPRIVAAVHGLLERLRNARAALGVTASDAQLVAGAGALQVGVTPNRIARLGNTSPAGTLAFALVALADLVQRGVPPDTAATAIEALAHARSGEEEYAALRRLVEQDIRSGAAPAAAALERARALADVRPPGRPPDDDASGWPEPRGGRRL